MTTGYKTVTPIQLGNLLHALKTGALPWSGARVWFACLEMVAIREAARRSVPARRSRSAPTSDFTVDEVVARTGLAPRVARRTVGRLQRLGLLTLSKTEILFPSDPRPEASTLIEAISGGRSPRRPIPVPRRLARHLASSPDATAGHVMLGYVLRGLSLERRSGEIRSAGTVKAGWLADTLGLGLRTVKAAQARLRAVGWIAKDTGSRQWKLNRDGAWFRLNPDWQPPEASTGAAPLPAEAGTPAAPPKKDRKTPSESKNQRTHPGVWILGTGRRTADGADAADGQGLGDAVATPRPARSAQSEKPVVPAAPCLTDIRPEDLHSPERLHALRRQAHARGWIRDCEADTLNFFAAAVRARSTEARDPARVFVSLVRGRRWGFVTQAHEHEARRMLQPRGVARGCSPVEPNRAAEIVAGLMSALNSRWGHPPITPNQPPITQARTSTGANSRGAF
jgi:DNA-binding IclR family transcriptional regulator